MPCFPPQPFPEPQRKSIATLETMAQTPPVPLVLVCLAVVSSWEISHSAGNIWKLCREYLKCYCLCVCLDQNKPSILAGQRTKIGFFKRASGWLKQIKITLYKYLSASLVVWWVGVVWVYLNCFLVFFFFKGQNLNVHPISISSF